MRRYVIRMLADQWRQWAPAVAVVAVITTMVGLCVLQFAWTSDPTFRVAVDAAGVPLEEFQILSITLYSVVAMTAFVGLTVVGRASVHATSRSCALWLLLGAAPSTVFASTLLVLVAVSLCGALLGATVSTLLGHWAVPAVNSAFAPSVDLPEFVVAPWAPLVVVLLGVVTATVGGVLPARRASTTPPILALRSPGEPVRRSVVAVLRIVTGVVFLLIAGSLVVASAFAPRLGATNPAAMFNLAVNAGGSALVAVYVLCPEIVGFVLWTLHGLLGRLGLVAPALGTRAAASRVQLSATTVAPLAAGLGGIGLLLCSVNSIVMLTEALQPGSRANLTDVWTIIAVVAVTLLATSAAVVALSARGREREIALLQAAGTRRRQIGMLIAAESFAMAFAASVAGSVPVVVGGVVSALVSRAMLGGDAVVAWPVGAMLLGLAAAWLTLFLILLAPAMAPLREGPGAQLRSVEV